jgi:DNA-binding GntR family transcriptional regulator
MPIPAAARGTKRPLLRDTAEEQIRDAIMTGVLEPGELLRDQELCDWLGISRTPIREALGALARAGLVETRPNQSTRVAVPDPDCVLDAVRTLGAVFGGIVAVTVPVMPDEELDGAVRRIDGEIGRLVDGTTTGVLVRAFHAYREWLRLCPNAILVELVRQGTDGLAFSLRHPRLDEVLPAAYVVEQLGALRDALRARDAEASQAAIQRAHLVGVDVPSAAHDPEAAHDDPSAAPAPIALEA